jgi:exosome complex component RRP42
MSTSFISRSERSYIQSALQSQTPIRADGRGLCDFRTIALETGVTPLANGSARVNIGVKNAPEGPGGTEILVAVKLEVENAQDEGASNNGQIVCSVIWCVISRLGSMARNE